jgi:hypothetical protein
MTTFRLFKLFRHRAALITGVFIAFMLFGMGVTFLRTEVYEVSMLLTYGSTTTEVVKRAIEDGALNGKIARQAGLKETETLPVLKAGQRFGSQLVRVFSFVPAERTERTKKMFNALVTVLNEEFPAGNLAIRAVLPPAASSSPAEPSHRQTLIAFALLGLFAGLAAALWADERGVKNL